MNRISTWVVKKWQTLRFCVQLFSFSAFHIINFNSLSKRKADFYVLTFFGLHNLRCTIHFFATFAKIIHRKITFLLQDVKVWSQIVANSLTPPIQYAWHIILPHVWKSVFSKNRFIWTQNLHWPTWRRKLAQTVLICRITLIRNWTGLSSIS